jgi:polyferredoxin
MDKDGKWYNTYDEVEEDKRGRLMRSHFSPEKSEDFAEQLARWYVFNFFLIYIFYFTLCTKYFLFYQPTQNNIKLM